MIKIVSTALQKSLGAGVTQQCVVAVIHVPLLAAVAKKDGTAVEALFVDELEISA